MIKLLLLCVICLHFEFSVHQQCVLYILHVCGGTKLQVELVKVLINRKPLILQGTLIHCTILMGFCIPAQRKLYCRTSIFLHPLPMNPYLLIMLFSLTDSTNNRVNCCITQCTIMAVTKAVQLVQKQASDNRQPSFYEVQWWVQRKIKKGAF